MELLKCPVCNEILFLKEKSYKCCNNHCYDISSKGYTNMLLANQHHSLNPGDSKEMIEARVRFLNTNKYHVLRQTITDTILNLMKDYSEVKFGDIACGEGYYTSYIHQTLSKHHDTQTIGVDISKYGIIECCKKVKSEKIPNISYCIGNLMNLPFINQAFDVLLNCFAPMDEEEFARVLKDNGYYIRVLPDADHLWGMKEVLYKQVVANVMKETNLKGFKLVDSIKVKDTITLENQQQINDLYTMTPYYYKSPIDGAKALSNKKRLDTIISFVILVYKKA